MKHLLWGLVIAGVLVLAVFGLISSAQARDRDINISCSEDIDNIVNSDSKSLKTGFVLQPDCVHSVSATLKPYDGDQIFCQRTVQFIQRGPAFDPEPSCTIRGQAGLDQVIKPQGFFYGDGFYCEGG